MRGIGSFLRSRRLANAIANGDASAVESVLTDIPTEEVVALGPALLAIAVKARRSQFVRTLLHRGVNLGIAEAFGSAVASADVPTVEAFVEFGALDCWWQTCAGPGSAAIRRIYERPDVKARLLAVIEPAKERMIRAGPQDLQRLWTDGPEDEPGRTVFAWLKEHHGERVTVAHSWDVGRYGGDESITWSREGCGAEADESDWIVGTPDVGAKTKPWAAADATLQWALGKLRMELELPLSTYQEAQILGSKLVYWSGTDLESGPWKPSGEIPTWPVAAKSKAAVYERSFLTFEAAS